jgi:menaquinone-dependent protoporphyrinogen oxidase
LTVAATTPTCSGLGYAVTRTPEVNVPEMSFREASDTQNPILITYATRAGSTTETAGAIAESLYNQGFSVDAKPVKEKPALGGYAAAMPRSLGRPVDEVLI